MQCPQPSLNMRLSFLLSLLSWIYWLCSLAASRDINLQPRLYYNAIVNTTNFRKNVSIRLHCRIFVNVFYAEVSVVTFKCKCFSHNMEQPWWRRWNGNWVQVHITVDSQSCLVLTSVETDLSQQQTRLKMHLQQELCIKLKCQYVFMFHMITETT